MWHHGPQRRGASILMRNIKKECNVWAYVYLSFSKGATKPPFLKACRHISATKIFFDIRSLHIVYRCIHIHTCVYILANTFNTFTWEKQHLG